MDTTSSELQKLLDKIGSNTMNIGSGETLMLPGFETTSITDSVINGGVGSTTSFDFSSNDTITLTGAVGSAGYDFGSSISGGYVYAANPVTLNQSGRISLTGEKADIEVNGISVMDTLKVIQERLNILTPNPELEAEWEELRVLGEQYRALEKKCKEKIDIWNKLKQMPPPEL